MPSTRTLRAGNGDGAPDLSKLCWDPEKCSFRETLDTARAVTHLLSPAGAGACVGNEGLKAGAVSPGAARKGAVTWV